MTKGRKPTVEADQDAGRLVLAPPEWLSDSQKAIWRDAINNAPIGILSTMDAGLLTNWVVACDLHRQAAEQVEALGLMVKSPKSETPMQNPYLAILNRQAELMLRAAGELGFTPVARTRITRLDPESKRTLTDEPKGKKELANDAAVTAQVGTEWDDLLPHRPGLH